MVEREHYRGNLRHVVRPDEIDEREASPSVTFSDYELLFVQNKLQEYVAYEAPSDSHERVAKAYVEYIDMVVREEHASAARLYAHTDFAREVLTGAVDETAAKPLEAKLGERLRRDLGEP